MFGRRDRLIECGLEDLKNGDIIIWRDAAGDSALTRIRLQRFGAIPQGTWLIYGISKMFSTDLRGLTRTIRFVNAEGQLKTHRLSRIMYENAVQDVLRGEKQ